MNHADVVIVLGAAVWSGGRASPTLVCRVTRGVALLREGAAPRLLLTGGLGRNPPAEAEVMRRLAEEQGADPACLLLEGRATSTFESAMFCAEIMRAEGWSKAIVVTDGYHLPRSLMSFRAFGVHAEGSASGGGRPDALGWTRWIATMAREAAACGWYALRLIGPAARQRHG